jgi:hypothetical protein
VVGTGSAMQSLFVLHVFGAYSQSYGVNRPNPRIFVNLDCATA